MNYEELYRRSIDDRDGFWGEQAQRIDWHLEHAQVCGCRAIPASVQAAIAKAQQLTRNYAKRQLTWFRNQLPDWPWLPVDQALPGLLAQLDVKNII